MLRAMLFPLDLSGIEHGLQRGLDLGSGSAIESMDYQEREKVS